MLTVYTDFKVTVISVSISRAADVADYLSLPDFIADIDAAA